jgi:D-alanine transaminase
VTDVLWFNGRFTTIDERVLTVEDRGFLFGDAVYEVFKFLGKRPVFLPEHWRRLSNGLMAIEIRNPWTEASFASSMQELLERTSFDDGIVYIEVSRGAGERAHVYPDDMTPTAVAFSRQFKFPDAAKKERGVRLITTHDLRWKHCDVKSANLLPNALGKKKAQRAGGDEVLFIDRDIVRECGSSSFFIVRDGRVITHPLDYHILPGVTRDRVIALAGDAVDEREIARHELDDADEIFITSTTLGVMPVHQIDDGMRRPRGAVTADLQRRLDELERS